MSINHARNVVRDLIERNAPVPDEEWSLVEDLFKLTHYKKGEIIEDMGALSTMIGVLEKGIIRIFFTLANGTEKSKRIRCDGDFFANYNSLLTKSPSHITIQALEDCTVWITDYDEFMDRVKMSLFWQVFLRKGTEKEFLLKEKREYELLTLSAQERYLSFLEEYFPFRNRISQYHVANYLGIDRSSLNRIIKSLK
jgi:CRP-like cAMP-binding protein